MTETAIPIDRPPAFDTRWVLSFEITPGNRRSIESLVTLSDGRFARQGLPIGPAGAARPGTFAAGVYDDSEIPTFLELPTAPILRRPGNERDRPTVRLDLLRGTLTIEIEVDNGDR